VTDTAAASATSFATLFDSVVGNIATVVRGKRDSIEFAVMALLAEGHLLIEDVPGVGKTSLAKALAGSIDCTWKRVQFTPDLLPTDLVGVSVYERSNERFRFQPGPLFANIVLADEINRASPKTQSALLEAMEERQISADGVTHILPPPFMVIATQNPVEQEGTYRLPESQLDRFLLRISLGYPGRTAEMEILDGQGASDVLRQMQPVVTSEEVLSMVRSVREVYLASALKSYMIDIAEASRRHTAIELGLSPRATLQLSAAVRAHAAAHGRDYGTPDDVKAVAVSVLSHRLLLRAGSNARTSAEDLVRELLGDVPVPVAR
jgi:MoxR-like ATPase